MHGTGLAPEEAESSGNERVVLETLKNESCRSWRASRAGSPWLRGVESGGGDRAGGGSGSGEPARRCEHQAAMAAPRCGDASSRPWRWLGAARRAAARGGSPVGHVRRQLEGRARFFRELCASCVRDVHVHVGASL
ncbi:hypothetical protein E2562_034664 [Oryza meyeriana var. granulata]|uniref:Uncharacterized protein n=1 Tax=Oryza meyeriana var. granulata TaxID=110450 RepID=A0A6G1ECM0_9ORYZ|nr:hypothetical protein E2562_034664 [Oryza meyeriana var. granulata]